MEAGGESSMRGIWIGVTAIAGEAFFSDDVETAAVPEPVQRSGCPGREARALALEVSVPGIVLPALLSSSCTTAER